MISMFLRRTTIFREAVDSPLRLKTQAGLSSRILRAFHNETEAARNPPFGSNQEPTSSRSPYCSPLFFSTSDQFKDFKIDIVDDETWQVSTGFADVQKHTTTTTTSSSFTNTEAVNSTPRNPEDPDFDEIDDLRICGNLFYKIDRDSKEYEEYYYDFHRKKSGKKSEKIVKETQNPNSNSKAGSGIENVKTRENPRNKTISRGNRLTNFDGKEQSEGCFMGKRQRTPTFNQLTAAYHEPFCLDVYISKASVRACIVHRATSNVVAVAHSISKDMKFDLGSTKNTAACAAVGKVLAQRALADDIYNVVYTPRKGERIEGKLQSVVESVMNNGVTVKVKIKKKKARKGGFEPAAAHKHH